MIAFWSNISWISMWWLHELGNYFRCICGSVETYDVIRLLWCLWWSAGHLMPLLLLVGFACSAGHLMPLLLLADHCDLLLHWWTFCVFRLLGWYWAVILYWCVVSGADTLQRLGWPTIKVRYYDGYMWFCLVCRILKAERVVYNQGWSWPVWLLSLINW